MTRINISEVRLSTWVPPLCPHDGDCQGQHLDAVDVVHAVEIPAESTAPRMHVEPIKIPELRGVRVRLARIRSVPMQVLRKSTQATSSL